MAPPTLPHDDIKHALTTLQEDEVFLKATKPNGDNVWLADVPAGVKWINPSQGRHHVGDPNAAVSVLRHYQQLDIVPKADAPETIQQAAGGWFS
jgi:hypothetical protein